MDLSLATSSSHQDQEQDNRDYNEEHRNDAGSSQNPHNVVEKEHMFDKVVTPSDVGKLNRLVIPKQHAERYFPLDSSSNLNGMLLNFEDRNGKAWRFRYSYWNSSQSYVITKGWSRFVKEKKLDAGDVVSFHRGTGDLGRDKLYIDWRHRPSPDPMAQQLYFGNNNFNLNFNFPRSVHYGSRVYNNSYPPGIPMPVYRNYDYRNSIRNLNFEVPQPHHMMQNREQEIIGYGYGMRSIIDRNYIAPLVIDSVPVVPGRIPIAAATAADVVAPATVVAGKRLRLFGVNMDYGGDLCTRHGTSNSNHGMPRGETGAASSSRLQERGNDDDDDIDDGDDDDDDQHAKKGKSSSLSFGLGLMRSRD